MAARAVFVKKGARFGLRRMRRRVLCKGNSQNLSMEDAMRFRWCAATLLRAASLSVAANLGPPPAAFPVLTNRAVPDRATAGDLPLAES